MSWYLQVINFLYYYHYSRCIMKIILLYTRHWTTDVGPLKWFGQNCTTEQLSYLTFNKCVQEFYKLKLSCFVNIFYKALGENAQRFFRTSFVSFGLRCSNIHYRRRLQTQQFHNQRTAFDEGDVSIYTCLAISFR